MPIRVKVTLPKAAPEVTAMLDTGADENFMSLRFLLEAGWKPTRNLRRPVGFVDGQTTTCFDILDLDTTLTDTKGQQKSYSLKFYVIDMTGFDVILGKRWLWDEDPMILTWRGREWQFRKSEELTTRIKIENPKRFNILARTTTPFLLTANLLEPEEGVLPQAYKDYAEVFSEEEAATLPSEDVTHEIDLKPDSKGPPYGPLYPCSAKELEHLRIYLEEMQQKGWIRESTSPAGAPILFVKKADGSLRVCVDYRGLNEVTIKNRYPLPRIDEMLDRLVGSKLYTKIDLRDAYHRIRIKRGDEWKTAFRTRYGHFEYLVMPFGLTNAPATFQSYIHDALKGLVDDFVIVYLDDILIFSKSPEEHEKHVKQVLQRLKDYRLFAKASKCSFHQQRVKFLGYVIDEHGTSMDTERTEVIANWPEPKSVRDIQVFLGFTGFFRKFIRNFSTLTAPLSDMTKGDLGMRARGFKLSPEAKAAFDKLREAFINPPVVRHFDPDKRIKIITDASLVGRGAILLQPDSESAPTRNRLRWHPVAFLSQKHSDQERRWLVHDQELGAIVYAFQKWRHYLEGSKHTIRVQTDHQNLTYFFSAKKLSAKQARWAQLLAAYDFEIEYKPGVRNPSDAPSRRPDFFEDGEGEEDVGLLPTLQQKLKLNALKPSTRLAGLISLEDSPEERAGTGRSCVDLEQGSEGYITCCQRSLVLGAVQAEDVFGSLTSATIDLVRKLQQGDAFAQRKMVEAAEISKTNMTDSPGNRLGVDPEATWTIKNDVLHYQERVYVPADMALRSVLMKLHHDHPYAGHFGVARTSDLLRRKYYWSKMDQDVDEYVRTCEICQLAKVRRHRPYGQLQPLPVPSRPSEGLSMDFITDLPPSMLRGTIHDAILVIVDRFTKLSTFIPCKKSINAEELADLVTEKVFNIYGYPDSIVSDRGSLFTSGFWSELMYQFGIKRRLSTAFHPQTDGQTERLNQVLEHYLRCYTNQRQDDWSEHLSAAQFAYNNSKHASTKTSPLRSLVGFDPKAPFDEPVGSSSVQSVQERTEKIREIRETAKFHLERAAATQTTYYNRKHQPQEYSIGDKVMLSMKNLKSFRPNKKLDFPFEGSFEVIGKVGRQAYRLRLPSSWRRIHPVFHVSLLEPYYERKGEKMTREHQPIMVDDHEEWEIEAIVNHRTHYRRKQYLVKWLGYPSYENSWLDKKDLDNARELLEEYENSRSVKNKKDFS